MSHLLTLFQEVQHYQNELARHEVQDVFHLLEIANHLQQKWQTTENDLSGTKRIIFTLQEDISQVRLENKNLKAQLVEARSQIAATLAVRKELERERNILAEQVEMVRDLLRDDFKFLPEYSRKKLQFLNERPNRVLPREESESAMLDGIEYDKTDDSLDGDGPAYRPYSSGDRKKRSISLTHTVPSAPGIEDVDDQTPRKRSRDDMQEGRAQFPYLAVPSYPQTGYRSPLNRSFSEPHVNAQQMPQGPRSMKSGSNMAALSPATAATTGRRHAFLSRTALKAEYCDHCDKRFNFAGTVWRCEICKMQCHADCRELALLPCIPRGTPITKNQKAKLVDFVPRESPMVPSILVHCVNEIDSRGLTSLGLYRVPGSETQVLELLEKMMYGRRVPNLRLINDVNVLAGCVKKFLLSLAEPLIPPTSFIEFLKAGELKSEGKDASLLLHKSILELPQPNRDTLAFLMIHFQKVAEYSEENKMTKDNLAKCLAPTFLGSSSVIDNYGTASDVGKLITVMNALFDFQPDYWSRFLKNSESTPLIGNLAPSASPMVFSTCKAANIAPMSAGYNATPSTFGYKSRNNQRKFFNPPWKYS